MAASTETKAAALEGLDFIETEEDVKAVEAATLKIQSTFRGKKIRSKLIPAGKTSDEASSGAKQQPAAEDKRDNKAEAGQVENKGARHAGNKTVAPKVTTTNTTSSSSSSSIKKPESCDSELVKKIGEMQVNDKSEEKRQAPVAGGLYEDEAERAATKIQAGFKGYKTRKELEGKLPASSTGGAQQAAPSGPQADK